MVLLAHLSDIHITAQALGWKLGDWLSKRYTGWLNYRWLGRGHRFRQAGEVLSALVAELNRDPPDRVVFSGDATALGFEAEFALAAQQLGLADGKPISGLAVPGNHDYYTRAVEASGLFERYFSPWQQGIRIGQSIYPFAQKVGSLWLIAVNSCTGNFLPWDAGGSVRRDQLQRLEQLFAILEPGPRILVTHYPVRIANGTQERCGHGLKNLKDVVQLAVRGGVVLWLHGHRHGAFHHLRTDIASFPVICAGSATQNGYWSYGRYAIAGRQLQGLRRVFDPQTRSFQDGTSFEIDLPF